MKQLTADNIIANQDQNVQAIVKEEQRQQNK